MNHLSIHQISRLICCCCWGHNVLLLFSFRLKRSLKGVSFALYTYCRIIPTKRNRKSSNMFMTSWPWTSAGLPRLFSPEDESATLRKWSDNCAVLRDLGLGAVLIIVGEGDRVWPALHHEVGGVRHQAGVGVPAAHLVLVGHLAPVPAQRDIIRDKSWQVFTTYSEKALRLGPPPCWKCLRACW